MSALPKVRWFSDPYSPQATDRGGTTEKRQFFDHKHRNRLVSCLELPSDRKYATAQGPAGHVVRIRRLEKVEAAKCVLGPIVTVV